jgi:hypothetical protein
MKDWLAQCQEVVVPITFAERGTLFVDSKVHGRRESINNVEAVLETDLHVVLRRLFLHPLHVVNRIGCLEVQAVVVLLRTSV